jgi:hypothetical protein
VSLSSTATGELPHADSCLFGSVRASSHAAAAQGTFTGHSGPATCMLGDMHDAMASLARSDLLDDPQENLCIAPGGVLEAGLVAALWVLFAPPAAMAGAGSMQDVAARLTQRLNATGAYQNGSTAEDQAAQAGRQQGAEQRHSAGSDVAEDRRQTDDSGTADEAADDAGAGAEQGSGNDGEAMLSSVQAAQAVAALPEAASAALANSIRQRLLRYSNVDLEADEALLAAAKQEPASEARAAKLAALTLVVAEKRILMEALTAVDSARESIGAEVPVDVKQRRRQEGGSSPSKKRAKR